LKGALALAAWGLAFSAAAASGDEPRKPERDVLAIVAGSPVTEAEVYELVGPQLAELRQRDYMLRAQALDEAIARRLISAEAAARGLTAEAFLKAEVEDRSTPTEAEIGEYYATNKARFEGRSEAEAREQIAAGLRPQRRRERQTALLRELRAKAGVKVLLEPLRVTVDVGSGAPTLGSPSAPVTIVEFSDFQCPFCARAQATLKKLRETYGEKLRFVFLDFPLQMHPQAPKAHEAAACAAEGGQFWAMHDRLFANQARLEVADLKRYATEIGLDEQAFAACLDSGRRADRRERDLEEGLHHGVTATPAFFINGRMLMGAQPFEAFVDVIDDELERAASPSRPGSSR
jgi:protein-disulfide isomerase